jgi:hypothetical protein
MPFGQHLEPLVKQGFIHMVSLELNVLVGSVGFGVVAGAAKQEVSAAQQPAPATAEQEVPTPVPKEPSRIVLE